MRVVIADDQARMRALARSDVERLGHTVVAEARDGHELLELAGQHSPDVVLMDWHMPTGNDGAETTAELQRRYPNVKVIVYSASIDSEIWRNAVARNVCAFVEKGDPAELGEAFENCATTSG